MKSFKEFYTLSERDDNQYTVAVNVDNVEVLYRAAMKAKDAKDLEKILKKMKGEFKDKVDLNKVDYEEIYKDLNESALKDITEGYSKLKKLIDKMVKNKSIAKSDAKALYQDVVDEYEEMGDNPDDATIDDVYEIADASGYAYPDED